MHTPPDYYPTLSNIPAHTVAVRIYHDNVLLSVERGADAAFAYLARVQSSSVSYALRFGGYRCEADRTTAS